MASEGWSFERSVVASSIFKEKNQPEKTKKERKKIKLPEKPRDVKKQGIKENKTLQEIKNFFIKYRIVFLLLIPIFLSVWLRAYPYYLPITDDFGRNVAYFEIKERITENINRQYPDIINKDAMIEKEFEEFLESNKDEIEERIREYSENIRSDMQDDNGQTYLLEADPYTWYEQAKNYLENGHFGDEIINDTAVQTSRNGRVGKKIEDFALLPYLEAQTYKIAQFFDKNITLIKVAFIMPLLLTTLAVILAFFIARKIAGNIAGLAAGTIVAINNSVLYRTLAGFADTDPFNILFPLLITWFFIEAFQTKILAKKLVFACAGGFFTGAFALAWKGWWYIFDFISITIFAVLIYSIAVCRKDFKKIKFLKHDSAKNALVIGLVFILSSAVFVSFAFGALSGGGKPAGISDGFARFLSGLTEPLSIIALKDIGSSSLWPNVLTTVAEFTGGKITDIISRVGGTLFFLIALAGVFLTLAKKDANGKTDIKYAVLLAVWILASAYAFTKGERFFLLMIPAFAIAFGTAVGMAYNNLPGIINKTVDIKTGITKIAVIVVLILLLISPIKAAHQTVKNWIPDMNDEWYETLTSIKENSEDAIITSWWDFGHWFVAISDRRVTFDGGDQGRKIHWVGKALLTDNEEEAIGILRMLNCKQDKAYEKLHEYLGDEIDATDLIYKIAVEEKLMARKILVENLGDEEKADEILEMTHCDDLIDNYFIVSEDMIGKAAVWSHFGSWDFRRAEMYHAVKGKEQGEGTRILKERFGKTENEAFEIYHQIQNEDADNWISGWFSYKSLSTGAYSAPCYNLTTIIQCTNGLQFNLETNEAIVRDVSGILHPQTLIYFNNEKIYEVEYSDNLLPFSAMLIGDGERLKSVYADNELMKSMFTRLFFHRGRGLEHFELVDEKTQFHGGKIYVYKVKF